MISKKWRIKNCSDETTNFIRTSTGLSIISSRIINNLGLKNLDEIKQFMKPNLDEIHSPFLFKNMEKAVKRIDQSLLKQELVCCYGDYDVDGITGSSLLYNFFQFIGGNSIHYVPDRITEGYGLNKGAITKVAAMGCKLLITADCGIRSVDEILHAKKLGVDIIITDHHEVGITLPDAYTIINPKLPDCPYPFKGISGSGVTMKLAWAVAEGASSTKKIGTAFKDFLLDSLSFAALGTIADMVPLIDENRAIVKFGLEAMRKANNPGIQALIETSIDRQKELTAEDVAFQIAPRINAAGRLGRSDLAMKLFTSKSRQEAKEVAVELDQLNKTRQDIERMHSLEAFEQAAELTKKYTHTIVLNGDTWHSGIIGIIASKILEKYYRPTFVISCCEETAKIGKGSARSIEGYSLPDALSYANKYLIQYGGHAMAAGFQIEKCNITAFREKIEEDGKNKLTIDQLQPIIRIDAETNISDLTRTLMDELHQLEPFGCANPNPLFATRKVNVIGTPKVIGKKNNHLKFKVVQHGNVSNVIAFNFADRLKELIACGSIDIAYYPYLHEWNGQCTIDLQLKDFRKAQ